MSELEEQQFTLTNRVSNLLERVEYRLIQSQSDKDEIYKLRYQAYLNEGAIHPNENEILMDKYDDNKNSLLFGIYIDGELCSSIRIHILSKKEPFSPAYEVFSKELTEFIFSDKVIIDPNRFVVAQKKSRKFPELAYITLRLPFIICYLLKADIVTATVRIEHQAFYKKVLCYRNICEAKFYPTLIKPLCLMLVKFHEGAPKVLSNYPFFKPRKDEIASLNEILFPFMNLRHA